MLGDLPDLNERLKLAVEDSLQGLKSLQSLMNDRFGIGSAVEVKNLRTMLTGAQSLLPDAAESADESSEGSSEVHRRRGHTGAQRRWRRHERHRKPAGRGARHQSGVCLSGTGEPTNPARCCCAAPSA